MNPYAGSPEKIQRPSKAAKHLLCDDGNVHELLLELLLHQSFLLRALVLSLDLSQPDENSHL